MKSRRKKTGFLRTPMNNKKFILLAGVVFAGAAIASAQGIGSATQDDVPRMKNFSAARVSSNNRYVYSNDDSKRIMPGQTLEMAQLMGPGMVTHIWVTVADNEYGWPRLLRLRVYYDGQKTPSVDAPLGDFFGVGHGYERELDSAMVHDGSSGRARNSYWQMPFHKSCRITVTNEGNRFVTSFYYHVDYRKYSSLPTDTLYFHAAYRQERPAEHGRNYEFLNIKGAGYYAGTVMSVVQTADGWFGEGDDLFYIDGAGKPQIDGTGTEDYFNDAWGLHVSSSQWTGTPVAEGEGVGSRLTGYRWHIPDPIPFTKSIRAAIEHAGWTYNSDGTARSGFEERPDYFSSVAFWYQQGVNQEVAEPPYGNARLPLGNAEQIEVENSIADVTVEKGEASVQKEVFWSKDLLFFEAKSSGAKINVPFDVAEDGRYEVLAEIALAPDYGDYVVTLDGKLTNSTTQTWAQSDVPPPGTEIIHNYADDVYVAMDRRFGWFQLTKGRHWLAFVCVGKDARSTGYNLGIDNVVLEKIAGAEEKRAVATLTGAPFKSKPGDGVYRGQSLASILATLKTEPETSRADDLRAVGAFGSDAAAATPQLIDALGSNNSEKQQAAAWAISQIGAGAKSAVPALIHVLATANPRTRSMAAVALASIGKNSESAIPDLIRALGDPVDYVRAPAADALGAIGPAASAAVHPLADSLLAKDQPVFVMRSIAAALGDIGAAAHDAIPALTQATKMIRVSYTAEEAILKIEGKPVPTWH
jgi:hypothetical protein